MIILNEKAYVEDRLRDKNIEPSKMYPFLSLYARYLYHENHWKKAEILDALHTFLRENDPGYSPAGCAPYLEKYANSADKYLLCKCPGIRVTRKEIAAIEEIHDKVLERLAFTLLCLAKFQNHRNPDNHNWVSYGSGEIYSMACINTTSFEKDLKLGKLRESGRIAYAKKINNLNIQVLYMDDDSEEALFVSDFRKLGNEWRLFHGENYFRCTSCGILTKRKNNSQKYCRDCSEHTRNERQKAMMQKRRKTC